MRNLKITLEYDGTNYFGWQRQKDSSKLPTVQSVLEDTLKKIFKEDIRVIAAGRTDTGVHALGQVCNFKVLTRMEPDQIQKAINAYLPRDIFVKKVESAPPHFHARHSARTKWYRYTILYTKSRSVFNRRYALHYPYHLDLRLMKKAAKKLDYKVAIKKDGDFIYIDVTGRGFGYKMVRRIVGFLVGVANGSRSVPLQRDGAGAKTAPACGLVLQEVEY